MDLNRKRHKSRKKKALILLAILAVLSLIPFISLSMAIEPDGVWNPESYYQRYRGDEYSSSRNFFQWWYFSLKDYENNQTFAFTYALSEPAKDKTYEGVYLTFAEVSPSDRYHIYYRYPLSDLKISGDYNLDIHEKQFSLDVLSSDFYHLKGVMNSSIDVWIAEGISEKSSIRWDLYVDRIVGWYGQQDIERFSRDFGTISWNTYGYDSVVWGSIEVNGTKFLIANSSRFRMYCDMNWGENFPSGEPEIDYPWGWFYTGKPATNPENDFALIAGVGRQQLNRVPFQPLNARFASMYNAGEKLGIRFARILDKEDNTGKIVLHTARYGETLRFDVDRSNWVIYKDLFGEALIPLIQVVTIETTYTKIVLFFNSTVDNYNRLLFPSEGYCFSDFEGLGVWCNTTIYERSSIDDSWTISLNYIDHNAGLEYGYKLDISV